MPEQKPECQNGAVWHCVDGDGVMDEFVALLC